MSRKLTGNTRYRPHKPLFGATRLILQVEETELQGGDLNDISIRRCTWWRDARVEDLPCSGK